MEYRLWPLVSQRDKGWCTERPLTPFIGQNKLGGILASLIAVLHRVRYMLHMNIAVLQALLLFSLVEMKCRLNTFEN